MNRTITINLSGIVFHIDDKAYTILDNYLESIARSLEPDDDKEEILQDVELRISELFNESINGTNHVITLPMVENVINIVGEPDAFSTYNEPEEKQNTQRKMRKLFRDTENRVAGGVCSGLGVYFSVDPMLFRILFIVLIFMFFSGGLIYLILWIVLPEAKTTAEKLEMRGEPVTFENIRKAVKQEFEDVKKNFNWK